jgi:CRP/FNR family cyclic AMP-dependent transcriptional regulator
MEDADTPAVKPRDVAGKSTLEILGEIGLFSGIPPAHLRRVVAIGVEETYATGAKVFEEGEVGDKLYIILDGAIRISRFVPGMGEEALIDDEARSATAVCHERCRLFVINRRDLEDLLFVDRDLAYELLWNFVRTLSRRLRATNDKMTFLATTSKF